MKFSASALLLLASTTASLAKNILMSNDDGWATANIRAFYYKLKEAGHNVYIVAPVTDMSGHGGQFDLPESSTLETDGEYGYPAAGAPMYGHEVDDDHVFYFNGTPASCVAFAFDYILPTYADNITIDMVVAGNNYAQNYGGYFSLSGTMGATIEAVYRGYPAIAFSAWSWNNTFYKDGLDLNDNLLESTIVAEKATELVNQIFESQGENPRAMGLGVGLNVNFPAVGYDNESCTNPNWVFTRIAGSGAKGAELVFDEKTQTVGWADDRLEEGMQPCYNGDCTLPTENFILGQNLCNATISAFSVDWDANLVLTEQAKALVQPLLG
ncbi:conserved hypothetical protein [Candida tropicalis MYA-3404]|uniref:Survival protein SurE-like phosphatase/nucleotidase domain-containing protein n=2 Tax=Candida tropicalis (strain ATCC MYA-3404 / T1) TaxID=294747 RepID=C5MD31_CANTT|nr:conserved hypothetical protein [Candida tropicalis MYA-3404]EER32461.1 conserved hypothetical protein [Candida tropicalis MYA-3404]KAG4406080.1 hypothetical protein JTP64_004951 [Candida tropicalis]